MNRSAHQKFSKFDALRLFSVLSLVAGFKLCCALSGALLAGAYDYHKVSAVSLVRLVRLANLCYIRSLKLLSTSYHRQNAAGMVQKCSVSDAEFQYAVTNFHFCLKLHLDALWHGHPVYMRSTCYPCHGHVGWRVWSRGTMSMGTLWWFDADR